MLRKMSDQTEIRQRKPRKIERNNSFCVLNNVELYRKLVTDDNSLPVKYDATTITKERTKISRSSTQMLSSKTKKYSLTNIKDTGSPRRPVLNSSPRYRLALPESPRSILKKPSMNTRYPQADEGQKSIQELETRSNESSDDDLQKPRFSYRLGPVQRQTKRVSFHPSSNAEPPTKNLSYALNPNVRFIHPILNSTFYKLPDIVRCRIVQDSFEDISKKRKT